MHILSENELSKVEFHNTPFPHFIIENALSERVHSSLLKELALLSKSISGSTNNRAFNLDTISNLGNFPTLIDVISAHLGGEFNRSIYQKFKKYFSDNIPLFKGEYKDLKASSSLVVNGFAREKITPRGPHVDNLKDAIIFLYYLKLPDDNTSDRNLEIYKYKSEFKGFNMGRVPDSHSIDPNDLSLIKTVPYKSNSAVIFLNGINSIHGVTVSNEDNSNYRFLITGGLKSHESCYNPYEYMSISLKVTNFYEHVKYKFKKLFV